MKSIGLFKTLAVAAMFCASASALAGAEAETKSEGGGLVDSEAENRTGYGAESGAEVGVGTETKVETKAADTMPTLTGMASGLTSTHRGSAGTRKSGGVGYLSVGALGLAASVGSVVTVAGGGAKSNGAI